MNHLELTSLTAVTCKNYLHEKGYLRDISSFGYSAEQHSNRKISPLLCRVYHARFMIIHNIVEHFVKVYHESETLYEYQILILGAGMDKSFTKYTGGKLFLVDTVEVINARKSNNLLDEEAILISADLTNPSELCVTLAKNGFCFDRFTIIVIECVLCYIPMPDVLRLLDTISRHISNSFLVVYDPVFPEKESNNRFLHTLLQNFTNVGAPIKSKFNSSKYLSNMFRKFYKHVNCLNMSQALLCILSKTKREISSTLDPFDEYAALALLHHLYHISIVGNNSKLYKEVLTSLYRSHMDKNPQLVDIHNTVPKTQDTELELDASTNNYLMRIRLLKCRLEILETRLSSLEDRLYSSHMIKDQNESYFLRLATSDDLMVIRNIILEVVVLYTLLYFFFLFLQI